MRERFDEKIPPCVGMHWPHGVELIISDADYIKDLFNTYDKFFTKQEHAKHLMSSLLPNGIIFAKSADPTYKTRRKLIVHAFYASKLRAMSDGIFDVIHQRLIQWPKLFPKGEFDLVKEMIHIQG